MISRLHLIVCMLWSLMAGLWGCAPKPPQKDSPQALIEQALTTQPPTQPLVVPDDVQQALVPAPTSGVRPQHTEERFDVSVANVEASHFFMGLVQGTEQSMVLHPDVSGRISLTLKDVTVDETMQIVQNVYGYSYDKTDTGYSVLPASLQTRTYPINFINMRRSGSSEMNLGIESSLTNNTDATSTSNNSTSSTSTSQALSQLTGSTTDSTQDGTRTDDVVGSGDPYLTGSIVSTQTNSNVFQELAKAVRALIGNGSGRSVMVSPRNNLMVVRAMPGELKTVESYLKQIHDVANRQVILEAKILEVKLKDSFQSGIDWSLLAQYGSDQQVYFNQISPTPTGSGLNSDITAGAFGSFASDRTTLTPSQSDLISALNYTPMAGMFLVPVQLKHFTALIQMLETQGQVQVLSSPRISAVNNEKAVIKVGTDAYFVTDVQINQETSSSGTTTTPQVTLTPFFSGISLDVTPQISDSGMVTLHVHPSIREVTNNALTINFGGSFGTQTLPTASTVSRESDSIVRAQSDQLVVIGGLMQTQSQEQQASLPVLGDIPFLGSLFRRTQQVQIKSELVILIKPHVVEADDWEQVLQASRERFKRLNKGYHLGGHTDVFGTMAERSGH